MTRNGALVAAGYPSPGLDAIFGMGPVIAVVTLSDIRAAVPLAKALCAGGVRVIEMTLRTPDALDAIARIAAEVPEVVIGAGSIRSVIQIERAIAAGAVFLVSPGTSGHLLREAASCGIPFLPGVATASEALEAADAGFRHLKFFPAEAAGGVAVLDAWRGPLPELIFCPTGGIDLQSAPRYLSRSNVGCIGGSWLTPADAIENSRWADITHLARDTLATLEQRTMRR